MAGYSAVNALHKRTQRL